MSNLESSSLQRALMVANLESKVQSLQNDLLTKTVDSHDNTYLHTVFVQKLHDKVDVLLAQLLETSKFVNMKNKQRLSYLHIASARGNARLVQRFIDSGANAREFTDKECPVYPNYSPLQFACDTKSLETIKALVNAIKLAGNYSEGIISNVQSTNQQNITNLHSNSNNDCNALSLLHLACIEDNPDVIDCFLDRKADVNEQADRDATYCPLYTPLHFAVEFNCVGNVQCLLDNGANIDLRNGFCMTPLHLAMYYSKPGALNRILEMLWEAREEKKANLMDANGLTYFHVAAALNDMQTIKKILSSGAWNINQAVLPNRRNFSNYTALHFAVRYSHLKMAKLLVSRGANLNTSEGVTTPLQVACEIGDMSLIRYLVKHSADATVVDPTTRKTTLHLLVQNFVESEKTSTDFSEFGELSEGIRLLVKRNVDVNAKDANGDTVLHFACKEIHQNELCVEELLDCGADVNVVNDEGKTALDLALENEKDSNYESLAMLYHHVQKLKDLGLTVDEKNKEFCRKLMLRRIEWSNNHDWDLYEDIYDDDILEAKREKRLGEIEELKGVNVDADVSLYDFMKLNSEDASKYANCQALKDIVEDTDFWVKYPTYAYLIRNERERFLAQNQ